MTAPNIERAISAAAGTAFLAAGVHQRGLLGLALGSLGAGFLYQSIRGRPMFARESFPEQIEIQRAITISATPAELYRFWRDFENVPRFMTHVASVRILDDVRAEWTAAGPGGARIRWRTELVDDQPDRSLSWRSIDRSPIDQRGTVRFVPAPDGYGTEVHLSLEYAAPADTVGIVVGKMLVGLTAHKMQEDLRHLKQLYETGCIPSTEGQPHGERGRMHRLAERLKQSPGLKRAKRKLIGMGMEVQS